MANHVSGATSPPGLVSIQLPQRLDAFKGVKKLPLEEYFTISN